MNLIIKHTNYGTVADAPVSLIMKISRKKIRKIISAWSTEDRQNFADRNFLKSKTIPSKKKLPPDKKEWD
jgi:hypothetical protein